MSLWCHNEANKLSIYNNFFKGCDCSDIKLVKGSTTTVINLVPASSHFSLSYPLDLLSLISSICEMKAKLLSFTFTHWCLHKNIFPSMYLFLELPLKRLQCSLFLYFFSIFLIISALGTFSILLYFKEIQLVVKNRFPSLYQVRTFGTKQAENKSTGSFEKRV